MFSYKRAGVSPTPKNKKTEINLTVDPPGLGSRCLQPPPTVSLVACLNALQNSRAITNQITLSKHRGIFWAARVSTERKKKNEKKKNQGNQEGMCKQQSERVTRAVLA